MANPTTNYGFVLPTPTDLVTDLPADFDVALQGVDTQMLTNANAAIAKTIVDAKGDIIAATAADAVSRLAVGANNTVLTADSTTATGLKWAAAGGTNLGYRVNTSGSNYSTTSTSFVNVDTTNMRVAIVAPPSGAVAISLTAIASNGGGGGDEFWTVSAGAGTSYEITAINGTYLTWFSGTRTIVIIGLTGGVAYNLDWQFRKGAGGGAVDLYSSVTTDRPKMVVTAL